MSLVQLGAVTTQPSADVLCVCESMIALGRVFVMLLVCHAACLHCDIMGTCLPHGDKKLIPI